MHLRRTAAAAILLFAWHNLQFSLAIGWFVMVARLSLTVPQSAPRLRLAEAGSGAVGVRSKTQQAVIASALL